MHMQEIVSGFKLVTNQSQMAIRPARSLSPKSYI